METLRTEQPAPRSRTWGRWALRRCAVLIGAYLFVVAMFATFQRSLIYHPAKVTEMRLEQAGRSESEVQALTVRTHDGLELHGWHLLAAGQVAITSADRERQWQSSRPVVLFFPGNAGHRQYRLDDFEVLNDLGADVVAFDYRGYGENPGHPTEADIAADAWSIWKSLVEDRKVKPQRIVLFGESLGGGVATRLATELCQAGTPPRGLILRSTFASLADAGATHYPWLPVHWLLVDRFDSLRRIPQMTAPLLMLHGELDQVVPFSHGKQLFDAAPARSASSIAKQFVALPKADHNDVLLTERKRVFSAIYAFLRSVTENPEPAVESRPKRMSTMHGKSGRMAQIR